MNKKTNKSKTLQIKIGTAVSRLAILLGVLFVCAPSLSRATSNTWDGGASGTNASWLSSTNWVTEAAASWPGSTGNTNAGTNTDLATFSSTGTTGTIGLNLNVTNNIFGLGAIQVLSARASSLNIGNSSGTAAGTLRLNGTTVNSVANVVLRNVSNNTLTLQAAQNGTMTVRLANSTNNIIMLDGTTASNQITISSNIDAASAGTKLTLDGSNSLGKLTLSGTGSWSGATTITAATLAVTGSGTIGSGNLSIASGAAFDISGVTTTSYTLSSTQTLSGAGTVALGAKTLTMNGTISPGTSGAGTLAFTASSGGTLALTSSTKFIFDLGTSADLITTQQILALGSGVINFDDFTFTLGAGLTTTTYNLITGASNVTGILGANTVGNVGSYIGTLAMSGNNLTLIVSVPEPQEYAVAICALIGVIIYLRRRNAA